MAAKTILHIDFDSFFASVEQQYNPKLRNKPIGVTAANSRTCIIASSREAKRLGIKTGARSYEAQKICPELTLVPADFNKYFDISKKFLNICKDYSPFTELFSIDEVFMNVTLTAHLFNGTFNMINLMKLRIREEIGEYITASFGVSHNKLLAKLASGFNKPNARLQTPASPHAEQTRPQASEAQADGGQVFFEIKPEDVLKIYQTAKLTDICGIGERIRRRLNDIGIDNLIQLRNVSLHLLVKEFGRVEGHFLKSVGLGIDESEVIPYTQPQAVKSVGRSYCLPKNEPDKRIVLQNLYELCEEVGIKLRRLGKKGKTIGLGLNGSAYVRVRKTFREYVDTGSQIYNLAFPFIERDLEKQQYVRQIHIWVSGLEEKEKLTLSLFDLEGKKDRIANAIDKLNDKFGDHTIRNGFLLYADKLTTVPNGYMADRYERNKLSSEF